MICVLEHGNATIDYEMPVFDAEYDNAAPPISLKNAVRSDFANEETRNTQAASPEHFLGILRQTDEIWDLTNTYSDMERDAET